MLLAANTRTVATRMGNQSSGIDTITHLQAPTFRGIARLVVDWVMDSAPVGERAKSANGQPTSMPARRLC
jgi:hypothetical protein